MQRIIDFHAHAFPDALAERAIRQLVSEADGVTAFLDGRVCSLIRSMDENHIETSVLCSIATRPKQFEPIFEWSRAIASERIVPFPSVHPADPQAIERIGQIAKAGFKGIKMHPYYQDFCVDDPAVLPLYEAMCGHDLMLTLHTGFDIAFERVEKASPRQILAVLQQFPTLRLITTHLGGWQQWDDVERYLIGHPVYMETSWSLECLEAEQARRMLLNHPAEYLLFGTDSPWTDQGQSIKAIESLNLPQSRLEKLFYENAQQMLGF
ncbi:MAG TPA: amidohydrolase [Phycisphaerales bacterium]|nr:amidohydrolase [Phycisphaerales bacterium]